MTLMNFGGFSEMVFLFFLALIIFGPKKLPEIGRQIGKALNEFKKASNEFKAQIEAEINALDEKERHDREILPPSEPPQGAVASLRVPVEPVSPPQLTAMPYPEPAAEPQPVSHLDNNQAVKAPDA
jgi:TatA/E family protein of Tat protein translocase